MNITVLLLASVQTFCNPMSIPDTPISHECWKLKHGDIIEKDKLPAWSYVSWQYEENGVKKARQFREIGEPEVLVEGNVWYLYVSSGLMWKSDDCGGTWQHIRLQEHSEYAPTCVKFRGRYYLTVSYSPLMVADSPEGPFKSLGHFERNTFGGDPDMASFGDPALFVDGDRLYMYWGCVSPSKSLWGCELDADHPTRAKTPAKRIMSLDPVKYPWMRPPLEGAYMFKRGDTYYFSNACFSPKGYCFVVWKGSDPLGPFVMQEKNPAFATARGNGLAWNTGHGSIYRDQYGDWWINYCIWPMDKKFHAFEKFIGQDRIEFEANGDLKVSSATCEPQWLPSSGKRGPTGWKRLPAKTAFPKAADDHLRTYAEFAPGSNEMTFEFDGVKELHAYRVIWCDLGLDENRGVKRGPYRYRVDCRSGGAWRTWYDASANDTELICDYREAPVVCADAVRLVLVGAPKGLTAAVTEFTAFGLMAGYGQPVRPGGVGGQEF